VDHDRIRRPSSGREQLVDQVVGRARLLVTAWTDRSRISCSRRPTEFIVGIRYRRSTQYPDPCGRAAVRRRQRSIVVGRRMASVGEGAVAWRSEKRQRWLPAVIASIPITIVFFAVLGIVLTAAGPHGLDLTNDPTSGWIAVLYGLPTLIALILTLRYRQPLLVTGNIFAIIFFVSLGDRVSFPELVGATMLAGAIVLVAAVLGVTERIAEWLPAPIVYGLIAGAVMPFVANVFTSLSTSQGGDRVPIEVPLMVGAALAAYLVSLRIFGTRVPPILPAFLAGLLVAAFTGQLGAFPSSFSPPSLAVIRPVFSWSAILTATPVLVALMTVQATIPSAIYMRSQGFNPPERVLNLVGGIATAAGSLLGPVAVSLALPPVLLTAGPEAGPRSTRYRSVYLPVAAGLLIALLASTAADLAGLVPSTLLLTMAGLALIAALVGALKEIVRGPLILGPVFAFAIALSDMNLFGLGPFFWSLVFGSLISLLLEREGWTQLRVQLARLDAPENADPPDG
jgi:benzoate membrane transport protein